MTLLFNRPLQIGNPIIVTQMYTLVDGAEAGWTTCHSLQLIHIVQQYWVPVGIGYGCWAGLAFKVVLLVDSRMYVIKLTNIYIIGC